MSYFNREMLLDTFTAQDRGERRKLMAQVDRERIEQDILNDGVCEFVPFECTYEQVEEENFAKMAESDQDLLNQIFEWVQGSHVEARRGLKYLHKLKKKYPRVPVIYNFIGVAYQTLGKEIKRHHVIKDTCKKFPNYVFGKISLAEYQLSAGHHEAIPEIFNHKLQLYMHYPNAGENPIFHGVEVQSFYTVMGRYYARNKQLAETASLLASSFGAFNKEA